MVELTKFGFKVNIESEDYLFNNAKIHTLEVAEYKKGTYKVVAWIDPGKNEDAAPKEKDKDLPW